MDHTLSVLIILNILICSIKTQSINEDTSLRASPNWLGSFYTTAECDVQKCCCIYGLLTLSKLKPNYLQFLSHLKGYNCPTNHQIDSFISMPSGFKTQLPLMSSTVDITLSQNSSVITLYYQNAPECSGRAVRNSAKSIITTNPIKMVLMILTIFIGKNVFGLYLI